MDGPKGGIDNTQPYEISFLALNPLSTASIRTLCQLCCSRRILFAIVVIHECVPWKLSQSWDVFDYARHWRFYCSLALSPLVQSCLLTCFKN